MSDPFKSLPENPLDFNNKNSERELKTPRLNGMMWQLAASVSENSHTALEYRRKYGFNVIRQPYGEKFGFYWLSFQFTPHYDNAADSYHLQDLSGVFSVEETNFAIMVGRTSGNLFVIDCETTKAFHYVIDCLEEREIPVWAVKTRRGGHIYLRSRKELENIPSGIIPNIEVRAHSGYVIAPPSIIWVRDTDGSIKTDPVTGSKVTHIYTWERRDGDSVPIVNPKVIDFLTDEADETVKPKFRRAIRRTDPYQVDDYLATGSEIRKGTRHDRLKLAATGFKKRGISEPEALSTLTAIAVRSGLRENDAISTIRSIYQRTDNTPHKRAKTPAFVKAQNYHTQHPFTGRSASIDRAVFNAFIECAKRTPFDTFFRAAYRELAEIAHVNKNTVPKAIKRFIAAGLIVRSKHKDHVSKASCYQFGKFAEADTYSVAVVTVCSVSRFAKNSPDAVERGALGKSGYIVYRTMVQLACPNTIKDIAKAAQLSIQTVYGVLRDNRPLPITGLVKRTGRLWTATSVTDQRLDELIALQHAPERSPIGRSARRIQRHANERAKRATTLFLDTLNNPRTRKAASQPTTAVEIQASPDEASVQPATKESEILKCPNCGQTYAAVFGNPPDICAYCRDMTTWKPLQEDPPISSARVDEEIGGISLEEVQASIEPQDSEAREISLEDKPIDKPEADESQSQGPKVQIIYGLKVAQAVEFHFPSRGRDPVAEHYQRAKNKNMAMSQKALITRDEKRLNSKNIEGWRSSNNLLALQNFINEAERRLDAVRRKRKRR